MTSKPNGGVVSQFISQSNFPWAGEFKQLKPGTAEFTAKWKAISNNEGERFDEAQHAYIKGTHFDKLVEKVKNDDHFDITTRSHALQDVAWSTAVQHGPNTPVMHHAIDAVRKGGPLNLQDPKLDEDLIHAIYAERGRKNDKGQLAYFSRNSAAVQQSVAKRFANEEQDAIKMLANERSR